MAPETLDDQSLRDLMKTHLNNKEAITSAIQNIWHGMQPLDFTLTYSYPDDHFHRHT